MTPVQHPTHVHDEQSAAGVEPCWQRRPGHVSVVHVAPAQPASHSHTPLTQLPWLLQSARDWHRCWLPPEHVGGLYPGCGAGKGQHSTHVHVRTPLRSRKQTKAETETGTKTTRTHIALTRSVDTIAVVAAVFTENLTTKAHTATTLALWQHQTHTHAARVGPTASTALRRVCEYVTDRVKHAVAVPHTNRTPNTADTRRICAQHSAKTDSNNASPSTKRDARREFYPPIVIWAKSIWLHVAGMAGGCRCRCSGAGGSVGFGSGVFYVSASSRRPVACRLFPKCSPEQL